MRSNRLRSATAGIVINVAAEALIARRPVARGFAGTWLALAMTLILAANGCGPSPRTVEVIGRVLHDGVPVEGAVVVFFAEKYADDPPAAGRTDGDGRYELRTYFSASDIPLGAIANDYVVAIYKYKAPDTGRAEDKMRVIGETGGDLNRYIAEEAVHDLWPDGVPDGWPDGYVPGITHMPMHIWRSDELREKLERLQRGIPQLPTRYADAGTSGLRASVEPSNGPVIFDFELTGEVDEASSPDGELAKAGLSE